MAKNLLQNSCDLVSVTPVAGTNQLAAPFGLVKLQSQVLIAGTTINFTGLANYPYTDYKIKYNTTNATGSPKMYIRVSSNNGASYLATGYGSSFSGLPITGITWQALSPSETIGMLMYYQAFTAGQPMCGQAELYGINQAGAMPSFHGSGTYNNSAANVYYCVQYGYQTAAATYNAFQLIATGNVTGTFTLYGYS